MSHKKLLPVFLLLVLSSTAQEIKTDSTEALMLGFGTHWMLTPIGQWGFGVPTISINTGRHELAAGPLLGWNRTGWYDGTIGPQTWPSPSFGLRGVELGYTFHATRRGKINLDLHANLAYVSFSGRRVYYPTVYNDLEYFESRRSVELAAVPMMSIRLFKAAYWRLGLGGAVSIFRLRADFDYGEPDDEIESWWLIPLARTGIVVYPNRRRSS